MTCVIYVGQSVRDPAVRFREENDKQCTQFLNLLRLQFEAVLGHLVPWTSCVLVGPAEIHTLASTCSVDFATVMNHVEFLV